MENKKNRVYNKKRKKVLLGCICLLVFVGITSIYLSVNGSDDTNNTKKSNFKSEPVILSFNDRVNDLAQYRETLDDIYAVGWLQVQGTNIDFPILDYAGEDTSKKLDKGWRSHSYRTGENREVLLGHNIINVSSTPIRDMSMLSSFEGLMAFVYEDIAQKNLYISYTKGGKQEIYKIFAIRFSDYDQDDSRSFQTTEEVKDYIKEARENSLYDYDIEVNENDQLITLKTCTRYFGADEKQEIMIDARRVRDDEKIETYEVTKNENYTKLLEADSN